MPDCPPSIAAQLQRLMALQLQEDELLGKIAELRHQEDELNLNLQEVRKEGRDITKQIREGVSSSSATTSTEEQPIARLTFQVTDLDGVNRETCVEGSIFKIGSDERSHVRVNDPQAARMMAVIEVSEGRLRPITTLIDLGNTPTIRLNGQDISKSRLKVDDLIEIGYGAKITMTKAEFIQGFKPSEEHSAPSPFNQKLSNRATTPDSLNHIAVTGCLTLIQCY